MKSRNVPKGKAIASIVGICLATLLIVFAFCGRYADGGFKDFGNFFLGSFGMAFYGLMAAVIVVCSFVLAGKSIKIPAKYIVFFALTFVAIVLLVHMLTTTFILPNTTKDQSDDVSFAEYASYVYNYYANFGIPTFGGIVFGAIAWAFTRVLTIYGAVVLTVALLALGVYFVGEFFYSYATGKLALQSKNKDEAADLRPSEQTSAIADEGLSPEEVRQRSAMSILFEGQTYPEQVSSKVNERYETSPQSTLDGSDRSQAATILFGDDAEVTPEQAQPEQKPPVGNSFFRTPSDPTPRQEDDFAVRGYFAPEQPVQPAPQTEQTFTDWKVTTTSFEPQQTVRSEQPVLGNDADDEPDITEIVADQSVFVQTQPQEQPTNDEAADLLPDSVDDQQIAPQDEEEQEDGNEVVAIPHDVVIETSGGTAVQEGMDFVTRDELRKQEESVHKYPKYNQPPVDLLNDVTIVEDHDAPERARIADAIVNKLAVFGIKVELADTVVGPSVTRYMFNVLSQKTRMSEFARLSDDIKACVEAQEDIRIEAPVHGTNQVGIEVANKVKRPVVLRSILESENFIKGKGNLVFAIGQEITGKPVVADLADMPHLLIAGATGSGKSVALNCLIVSLIYKYGPEYVRFVMVDPKFVELSRYNGIPHMLTSETITAMGDALAGMDYLVSEMEARYQLFRQNAVGNIGEYNARINPRTTQRLPYLVFVVDELADLMAASKQAFENKLQRLAQKSRAAGIHIVLATQRPDVKTITGTIKANLPCRMALKVTSFFDSNTIIGSGGAEKLLGKGDMLFMAPGSPDLLRVQGAFVSNDEIRNLVAYTRETNEVYYDEKISDEIFVSQKQAEEAAQEQENAKDGNKETQVDPYCKKALRFWLERNGGKASIASIQRNLNIGFNRAGRIMDILQKMGYVETLSPSDPSSKPLKVLITAEDLENIFPDLAD